MPLRVRTLFVAALTAVTTLAVASSAQTAQPRVFEAASVKPNRSSDPMGNRGIGMPGSRLEVTNLTLYELIAFAYGKPGVPIQRLLDEQIVGDQGWMTSDRFDVTATAGDDVPAGPAGSEVKLLMLRALLAERFKLAVHPETRTGSIYVLALAGSGSDGRLGPGLRHSDVDCAALAAARGGAPPPPPAPGSRPPCSAMIGIGPVATMMMDGQTMPSFAVALSRLTNRIVLDRTGLTGAFDIELHFDSEGLPGLPGPPPGAPRPDSGASSAPSLFTALQEQLGLKLNADRGPMDVIVVERAERPTED